MIDPLRDFDDCYPSFCNPFGTALSSDQLESFPPGFSQEKVLRREDRWSLAWHAASSFLHAPLRQFLILGSVPALKIEARHPKVYYQSAILLLFLPSSILQALRVHKVALHMHFWGAGLGDMCACKCACMSAHACGCECLEGIYSLRGLVWCVCPLVCTGQVGSRSMAERHGARGWGKGAGRPQAVETEPQEGGASAPAFIHGSLLCQPRLLLVAFTCQWCSLLRRSLDKEVHACLHSFMHSDFVFGPRVWQRARAQAGTA